MATRKIVNKHINQSSSTYVGQDGELFYDTVTNTLKISDGTTPGGVDLTGGATPGNGEVYFHIRNSDFTAQVGIRYAIDTTSGPVSMTLPANPSAGNALFLVDAGKNFATHNLTLVRNGRTIDGQAQDYVVDISDDSFGLVWTGSTWRFY